MYYLFTFVTTAGGYYGAYMYKYAKNKIAD